MAVILRSGPSKHSQLILWNTERDLFERGQWLKSKVLGFDLSPDGRALVCFVQSYRRKHGYDTWYALSRPPWFTALAVWSVGDSWAGDCRFLDDRTIYLCPGIREPTMLRGELPAGWAVVFARPEEPPGSHPAPGPGGFELVDGPGLYEWRKSREVAGAVWTIQTRSRPPGFETEFTWTPHDPGRERLETILDMEADFDQAGRMVAWRDGALYRVEVVAGKLEFKPLFDCTADRFEQRAAPPEALKW